MLLNSKTDVKRSGMILLIVVAFLSMFLVVGTTYLLVADSIRRTSDFDLNATDKRSDFALMPDIDPRYMFNFALGQILYDVADPGIGTTNSALRGNSLARDIYGSYIEGGLNDRPFQRTPPYTYPDSNHLYLGSYKLDTTGNPQTNPAIKPSFTGLDAVNLGLDVKNLEGYPGGNDSYWIDAGFPVMTTPDGRKYKALIAPLILDLDGRINLNVAGNLMQRNGNADTPYFTADHASNQGWGRWEINPKKLIENYFGGSAAGSPYNPLFITQSPFPPPMGPMVNPVAENEFLRLLSFTVPSIENGTTGVTNPPTVPRPPNSTKSASLNSTYAVDNQWTTFGRYTQAKYLPINNSTTPISNINPPQTSTFNFVQPHSYAQVDFNAAGEPGTWGGTVKPTFINANGFPTFGQGFGNGYAYEFDPTTKLPTLNMMTNKPKVLLPNEHFLDPLNPLTSNYHARNYNPYRTQSSASGVSAVFPVSETASILRWQGKGEPYSKSQLAQLLPKSLGLDMPYANAASGGNADAIFRQRIRNMVTTLSADLDRPAMVPIDVDVNTDTISRFGVHPTYGYPIKVGSTSIRPIVYATIADTPSSTINRTTPALKLNLNRTLTNYPAYNKTEGVKPVAYDFTNANIRDQYAAALAERQDFARDIFDYLKSVTGVAKMGSPRDLVDFPLGSTILADPEVIKVNRWLAQLAVNIVDFIDNDDFNTQFQWDLNGDAGDATARLNRSKEFLFGIEIPRLVINELFVQARNPDAVMDGKDPYEINTVVELLNPLPTDTNSYYADKPGSHAALLQYEGPVAGTPILNYKLSLIKRGDGDNGTTKKTGDLKDEINRIKIQPPPMSPMPRKFETKYFGDLDDQPTTTMPPDTGGIDRVPLNKWHGAATFKEITPSAYYKVGDSKTTDSPVGSASGIALDVSSMDLDITCLNNSKPTDGNCPQVVLQRLAVPGLSPQTEPTAPNYNPYITIDVFSKGKMYDARKFHKADNTPNPDFVATADRSSVERKTPFLDNRNQPINFDSASSDNDELRPNTNKGNSMGGSNSNATGAPMMMHLDRNLINPLELINVPCCFPHEFTQRSNRWNFPIDQAGVTTFPFAHNWPWFDENTRLYRFLEAVGVSPLQAGEALHGRALGKVNVNTMHSEEVFQAVADAKNTAGPNNFSSTDVTTAFKKLTGDVALSYPDQRPILSFGQANYTDGMGVKNGLNKTLMGYTASNKPNENFLDVASFGADGPNVATYARKELLTKIGNSVTTKSNVFAVWITTGYFEVTNDSAQPPTLGLEIGKADGINIRHRMFAIVDRTNMVTGVGASIVNVPGNGFVAIAVNLTHPNGKTIGIQNGMILTFDPNTDNEETVEVANGGATFTKPHAANCTIINRGNPGPWIGYDRTKDRDVVPYAEIIE